MCKQFYAIAFADTHIIRIEVVRIRPTTRVKELCAFARRCIKIPPYEDVAAIANNFWQQALIWNKALTVQLDENLTAIRMKHLRLRGTLFTFLVSFSSASVVTIFWCGKPILVSMTTSVNKLFAPSRSPVIPPAMVAALTRTLNFRLAAHVCKFSYKSFSTILRTFAYTCQGHLNVIFTKLSCRGLTELLTV